MRDKERIAKHAAGPAVTGTQQFAVVPISAGWDSPRQLGNQSGGSRQAGGWWPEHYQKDKKWRLMVGTGLKGWEERGSS